MFRLQVKQSWISAVFLARTPGAWHANDYKYFKGLKKCSKLIQTMWDFICPDSLLMGLVSSKNEAYLGQNKKKVPGNMTSSFMMY